LPNIYNFCLNETGMGAVRPKKHLGQHFLHDNHIAQRIVDTLQASGYDKILEIGPGTGILTTLLLQRFGEKAVHVIDIDRDSIAWLREYLPLPASHIIEGDFLRLDPTALPAQHFGLIGNLPYNISSQIFFRLLEWRQRVPEMVCMIQKEVADRLASPPGNKTYGILSVLLQAYYNIEYLFTVKPGAFNPPPKVNSAVIRLVRNNTRQLDCDEKLFSQIVKQGFQNRRKTLRNALKPLNLPFRENAEPLLNQRAEQLGVEDFVQLTQLAQ